MFPRYRRWDDGNWVPWDQLERGGRCGIGGEQGRRGRVPPVSHPGGAPSPAGTSRGPDFSRSREPQGATFHICVDPEPMSVRVHVDPEPINVGVHLILISRVSLWILNP